MLLVQIFQGLKVTGLFLEQLLEQSPHWCAFAA
jgi:hypothetical protein